MHNLRTMLLLVALSTVPVTFLTETAHAQTRDLEKAKDSYKSGKEAYDSGDFLTAAKKFVESYEYSGRDELLFNIGQAYRQAGRLIEAEKYFQQYLQAKPDAANADDVVNYVIEIQQQIAAEYGSVEFKASVAANVTVGDASCAVPCSLTLPAGKRSYTAKSADAQTSGEVNVESSKSVVVTLELQAPAKRGFVRLESDRNATVTIDGKPAGTLPLSSPLELPPGAHTLTLREGKATWTGDIAVTEDETLRLMVPLSASGGGPSWKRVAAYALGGTGVALAIGGVVMGMQASDTFDTLGAQESRRGYVDQDLVTQGESQAFTANMLYVFSALAVGSGVGLYVWDMYGGEDEPVAAPSEDNAPAAPEQAKPAEEDDLLL